GGVGKGVGGGRGGALLAVLWGGRGGRAGVVEGGGGVCAPAEGEIRWIALTKQDEPQLGLLQKCFGFHPLTIEDCLHFDQRPKIEEYGGGVVCVVDRALSAPGGTRALSPPPRP